MEPLPLQIIPSPELMAAIWALIAIVGITALILVYVELRNTHNLPPTPEEEEDSDPHGFVASGETKPLPIVKKWKKK